MNIVVCHYYLYLQNRKWKCEQKRSYEAKYGSSSSSMMTLMDAEIEHRTEKL